ncbi:MAG: PAS domain-containing protein [SAR324 cluster bacterium]|nr:PAS domain-containing protein [SAR324 cluster bacterium]
MEDFSAQYSPDGRNETTVFNHLEQAILLVNRNLQVVLCNEAAVRFWNIPQNKIIKQKLKKLFPQDEFIPRHVEQVFKAGHNVHFTDYTIHASIRPRITELTISPIVDKNHAIDQAVITISDQTHLAQVRAKEQEQAILNSIGLFTASIAHEIKNPLGGIKGVTQLLQRDLQQHEISTDSTEMILHELGRIERLLKQLSLYSQPMSLDYSTFNIHELLHTVLWFEMGASQKKVRFHREFDPSLPDIVADRDKLHQVFLNLIRNAVQASPDESDITIRSCYCRGWQVAEKNLNPRLKYYLIEIEDSGSGISPENRQQLFKPLFTTKLKGKGLGLSISFRIVHEHGGILDYRPSATGGAIFQVYIPARPESD